MGYTNSRATVRWWDLYTWKLKQSLSEKYYEHKNKFGKYWSPGLNMLNVKDTSDLLTIKLVYISHPFIKYEIFEETVAFPPRVTPIGIITYYFDQHIMTYIYESNYNIPWKRVFASRKRTDVYIIIVGRKYPKTLQNFVTDVSSQQHTGKYNKSCVIISYRNKSIFRANPQENSSILTQIRHVQAIGNKIISLPKNPPTPYHIGNILKIPL